MQQTYGGSLTVVRKATARWESAETWTVTGAEAAQCLRRVDPYLRLKSEQAQVALRAHQVREDLPRSPSGRSRWTDEAKQRCAVLKARMHELNRKGPTTPLPENVSMIARLVAGSWVTDQADLFSDLGWEPFSKAWPASGSMRSGVCFQRQESAVRTSASDSSPSPGRLLPTPRTTDTNGPGEHGAGGPDLRTAISLLPTPTVADSRDTANYRADGSPYSDGYGQTLTDATRLLPTPAARDWKSGESNLIGTNSRPLNEVIVNLEESTGALTDPPSDAGSTSSDDGPRRQLTIWDV